MASSLGVALGLLQTGHEEAQASPAPVGHEEAAIAQRLGRVVVPIGVTQGVAAELWQNLNGNLATLDARIPADAFAALGDPNSDVAAVGTAITKILAAI